MSLPLPFAHFRARFWRMLAPRWSHQPLSGEGAAKHGGRFNERDIPALYMSEDFTTAISEYEQELGIRPGTLCAYGVDMPCIVDLCDEAVRIELGISLETLHSPWKQVVLIDKKIPATWQLAARLREGGANGIRVPSVQAVGNNLVLWNWAAAPGQHVIAIDPLGDLPRDQASWLK